MGWRRVCERVSEELGLVHAEDCDPGGCDHVDEEPDCTADRHEWTREGEGGCRENPGVWSVGGTAHEYHEHCTHCGVRREYTRIGSQRDPGECDSVRYEEAS